MENLDLKTIYLKECVENGLSYRQVREKYNIGRGKWDYFVRLKCGYKADLRKYKANDTFFDNIDSEIKAYLLGFLYADGYLANDGRIGIRLQRDDEEIIFLIQKYICPNNTVEYTNNQNIKRKPQVSIRWKSDKMYTRLKELGFCIDKTHSQSNIFKLIPDNMKSHFLRGFTDGDGHISAYHLETGYGRKINICWCNGTDEILKDIQKYILKYGDSKIYYKDTYCTLSCDKYDTVFSIVEELYKNANFYLSRKQEKATVLMNFK